MCKKYLTLLVMIPLIVLSCSMRPSTFVQTMEPTWASIEKREEITNDEAWTTMVDTLVRNFDIEVMSKEDGYLRTGWLYSWTGKVTEFYKVRVTIKFSRYYEVCEIKSEAMWFDGATWVQGTDTSLLSTIKTDIMGKIGRVTR